MKIFVLAIIVFSSFWPCVMDVQAEIPEIEKARQYGARGQVTLCITDSTGKPVEKAQLSVAFWASDSSADAVVSEGQTDTNGCFISAGKTIHSMNYTITKEGFYKTGGAYWFYPCSGRSVKDGRWQPWNPTITVVLKERRNPVPMYAKEVDVLIPVQDKAIGFDLEKGDWVAPYGQGTASDLVFKYIAHYEDSQVFSKRMEMTFINPRDGVQSFLLDQTSEFMSAYIAPEEGYALMFVEERARTRTKILKSQELGEDQYLIFRVRTVTDKAGNIVSTNYGKLYGSIDYGRMGESDGLMFLYYFNPTANDRNLEFDTTRNLFGDTYKTRISRP